MLAPARYLRRDESTDALRGIPSHAHTRRRRCPRAFGFVDPRRQE